MSHKDLFYMKPRPKTRIVYFEKFNVSEDGKPRRSDTPTHAGKPSKFAAFTFIVDYKMLIYIT